MTNDERFLVDKDFLRLLDLEREKEIFVKIISLDFDEHPMESIEGRVMQGSISVDGTSTVRRTCSLSLVASELNIHEFYWGLNTKFKLYVGIKNVVKTRQPYLKQYKNYPDICWFKMGTYIISSFSTAQTLNQYTIAIQGKDKMTLLNGEMGGMITPLSWDFGKIDEINVDGTVVKKDYLIRDIILESVHEHAQEPYWNIIINDLDDYGLELLEYRGDIPMYLIYSKEEGVVVQMLFELPRELVGDMSEEDIIFDYRISQLQGDFEPTEFSDPNNPQIKYTIMKAEYGDVIGYRTTELVYAGELIANVGESVTSMLDKIVDMLGEFEYFYDLDGRFVFQRKKTYIQSSFSPIEQDDKEIYVKNIAETSACTYSFDNSMLVTAFTNTPSFNELKNDFSLWGTRKGITGIEIPIHLRYAIDTKPWIYISYTGQVYITKEGYDIYYKTIEEYKTWLEQKQREAAEAAGKIFFTKQPVPKPFQDENGNSKWWNLLDWANYYYLLSGKFPSNHQLYEYKNTANGDSGGNPEAFTLPDGNIIAQKWHVVDVDPKTGNLYYGEGAFCKMIRQTNENGETVVIPDYSQEVEHRNQWFPTMHGAGCTHYYEQFIYLNQNYPVTTLIYDPIIPTAALTDDIIANLENVVIEDASLQENAITCDWRELIYQMSLDYNKYHHNEDFLIKIDNNNTLPDGTHLYEGGYTGYEQYYIDLNGFWRDLYNPEYSYTYERAYPNKTKFETYKHDYYIYQNCEKLTYEQAKAAAQAWKSLCGQAFYFYNYRSQFVALSSYPTEEIYNQHPEHYFFVRRCDALTTSANAPEWCFTELDFDDPNTEYYVKVSDQYDANTHWATAITDNPELLNFWFDFLDSEDSRISQYKVCKIGDRTKASNDSNIKSIYFRDVPTVIFVDPSTDIAAEQAKMGTGYTYVLLPDYYENLFSMSSQGKSAMSVLNDWLYLYAYCAESITINTIPIYYLEPNTRIFVRDDNSGINGEYIVTRLTFPLTHNGTMSITATKAVENLY